ncbi:MAG: FHA domain-containing protein [Planctomycetota bacterium]|nr:FHA domain-containing protein [Planctomycetota bacterium]
MSKEEVLGYWLGNGPRPLPLRRQDVVTIGREPQNSIALDDTHVSRYHAVVECNVSGEVVLKDLASSNGTFLNEERLESQVGFPLRSGDLVRIGGKLFTFVSNQPGLEPRKVSLQAYQDVAKMQTRTFEAVKVERRKTPPVSRQTDSLQTITDLRRPTEPEAELSGSLHEQSLAQILQFLHSTGKTGELVVTGRTVEGKVAFQDGSIFFASAGPFNGDDAVYFCARQREGRFKFARKEFPQDLKRNIAEKTVQLIFEVCRRMDEEHSPKDA